jgi:hypothetical protein
MLGHNVDIVLTYPLICLKLPELDLVLVSAAAGLLVGLAAAPDQHLAAADLVVASAAAPDQHLVAAAVVEVVADLGYPAADWHLAVVVGTVDLEVDSVDLVLHPPHYLHLLLDYLLDEHVEA